MNRKSFIPIIVVVIFVLIVGLLLVLSNAATNTQTRTTQSTQDVDTQQIEKTPDLTNCIERANKSDANQTVIDQSIQACYEQNGY